MQFTGTLHLVLWWTKSQIYKSPNSVMSELETVEGVIAQPAMARLLGFKVVHKKGVLIINGGIFCQVLRASISRPRPWALACILGSLGSNSPTTETTWYSPVPVSYENYVTSFLAGQGLDLEASSFGS